MKTNSRRTLFFLLLIAAIIPACTAPPPEFRGTMQSGCAPHDAASTLLELEAITGTARVSFNLWPPAGLVPPATVEFDSERPVGQASYCAATDDCAPASWGRLHLRPAADSADVEGEWSLGLADGQILRGQFRASWMAIQALCG